MILDYLAQRQAQGLVTDRNELNAKFHAIAEAVGLEWLRVKEGENPLQRLWNRRDALSTNELLNFGDAVENWWQTDPDWLGEQIEKVKNGDEGNRAGAIFELLGLNLFLAAGNNVHAAPRANPGFDGIVDAKDSSGSYLVSIKNHGMTSYEKFFQRQASDLDKRFQAWLQRSRQSGYELRIICAQHVGAEAWKLLKADVENILDGQLAGTGREYRVKGDWQISLKNIDPNYYPLSGNHVSSMIFLCAKAHQNEQKKFVEDIRKGCANLVKHTRDWPGDNCPILLVRLCPNASTAECEAWAKDYFADFPNERVGAIILYQPSVVTSGDKTSLSHFYLSILGPKFIEWQNPPGQQKRRLPNMAILVGVIIGQASRKVIQTDNGQFPLDGTYSYQRGDIYRFYPWTETGIQAKLSNPAPGIMIHAEMEMGGQVKVMKMIAPDNNELLLLS